MSRLGLAGAAFGMAAFALAGSSAGAQGLALARLLLLGAALGGAAAADLLERRIPNRLVLPASAGCATLALASGAPLRGFLAGLALVAALLTLSLVSPAALGMGDVKLALLLVCGLDAASSEALALGLILAAFAGVLLLCRQSAAGRRTLPLAPFLGAGAALALLR